MNSNLNNTNSYSNSNSVTVYKNFRAIYLHFRGSYDYFKYNSLPKTVKPFSEVPDQHWYNKFAKDQFDDHCLKFAFCVCGEALQGKTVTIKQLANDPQLIQQHYIKNKQILDSFTYLFPQMVETYFQKPFFSNFEKTKLGYPNIVQRILLNNNAPLVFRVIIEDCFDLVERYKDLNIENIIWPKRTKLITKMLPFIAYDKTLAKTIIKQFAKQHIKKDQHEH